jgi:chromate transporter
MKELFNLFFVFARIGGFTFGGGYAMLPMIQKEIVENKKWASEEEIMNYYAVGQCTPGVIAVNTATFIGQKYNGTLGAIFATLGVVFPSLVIISLLAGVIEAFSHLVWVQNAFGGIRVCVCVLITNAVVKLFKKAVVDVPTMVIFLAVALFSVFLNLSPVIYVILAAIAGITIKAMGGKKA